jgi:hypothetical protein
VGSTIQIQIPGITTEHLVLAIVLSLTVLALFPLPDSKLPEFADHAAPGSRPKMIDPFDSILPGGITLGLSKIDPMSTVTLLSC